MSDAVSGDHRDAPQSAVSRWARRSYYCSGQPFNLPERLADGSRTARRSRTCILPPVVSVALQPIMARAQAALERGDAAEATQHLAQALRSTSLTREDELDDPRVLAEAWLLQDDSTQASAALGRPPDTLRETVPPAMLSHLWRLHGRVASARGDQSRAIALHGRALKHGRAGARSARHRPGAFELGALLQAGRRHRAHAASTSAGGVGAARGRRSAQPGARALAVGQRARADRAATTKRSPALRQAERLATAVSADDVLAIVCGNQANVAMMRHRYEQALALAERSVALHEQFRRATAWRWRSRRSGRSASDLGALRARRSVLHRALEVRRPLLFHETTGAIFDSLAQIHLMRGDYDQAASTCARPAKRTAPTARRRRRGTTGRCALLEARLALRRGTARRAPCELADAIVEAPGVPPADTLHAHLIAAEALLGAGRLDEAGTARRADRQPSSIRATMPGAWGEFLRVRAAVARAARRAPARPTTTSRRAAACSTCSASATRPRCSQLALGRLAAQRRRALARTPYLDQAARDVRGARRRARPRGCRGGARAADSPARASSSAPASMPTKRSCGGSWTRRRCRNCWPARPRPPSRKRRAATRSSCSSSRRRRRAARHLGTSAARPTAPARSRAARRRPSRPAACSCSTASGPSPTAARLIAPWSSPRPAAAIWPSAGCG